MNGKRECREQSEPLEYFYGNERTWLGEVSIRDAHDACSKSSRGRKMVVVSGWNSNTYRYEHRIPPWKILLFYSLLNHKKWQLKDKHSLSARFNIPL